jgi:hypothetical protein
MGAMSTTVSAGRDQVTTADPDRAVRVLEAHLGLPLASWQRYLVIAMLTPSRLWFVDAEP